MERKRLLNQVARWHALFPKFCFMSKFVHFRNLLNGEFSSHVNYCINKIILTIYGFLCVLASFSIITRFTSELKLIPAISWNWTWHKFFTEMGTILLKLQSGKREGEGLFLKPSKYIIGMPILPNWSLVKTWYNWIILNVSVYNVHFCSFLLIFCFYHAMQARSLQIYKFGWF